MRTRSGKRLLCSALFGLILLIGLPVALVYPRARHQQLNRDLIAAIKRNDTPAALALLNAGADGNAVDRGDTSISTLQMLRDWFQQLRGNGAPAGTAFRPAALALALDGPHPGRGARLPENPTLVQALLDHGADPNTWDKDGYTALMLAILHSQPATARLLLDRGAGLDYGWSGYSPLLLAISHKGTSTEIVNLLLDRGADVHTRDGSGATALMAASGDRPEPDVVKRLLAAGVAIDARDSLGRTALMYAAWSGHTASLKLLLEAGAKVDLRDKQGSTARWYATYFKQTASVRLLEAHGAAARMAARPYNAAASRR